MDDLGVGFGSKSSCSMVESSNNDDCGDYCGIPDLEADAGLAPVTKLLDNNLTIQEDTPSTTNLAMGIENNWSDVGNSTSSRAIPLPDMTSYTEFVNSDVNPIEVEQVRLSTEESSTTKILETTQYGPSLESSPMNNILPDTDNQESTIEVNTPAGVCGLRNLGNTCFMAAGLQSLTATPPVLQHFLEIKDKDERLTPSESLMTHFSSLLCKMWSGKYSVIQPTEFKRILGACHSQFKDYRQHDCQEFLALLLDSLHEQMNTAKFAKSYQAPATITTANSANSIIPNNYIDSLHPQMDIITASNNIGDDLMDTYDNSPSSDCLNSPNHTMAGSPKGYDDLDSAANSPVNSPPESILNDDEDTIDCEETNLESSSRFIHNRICDDKISECKFQTSVFDKSRQYEDFVDYKPKTNKISNTNILAAQSKSNNEIHFDSQKFPKENLRRTIPFDNSNLTENHDFDNKNNCFKRLKQVNVQKNNCNLDGITNSSDNECDNNTLEKCNVNKRMKLEDNEINKNFKCDSNNINEQCTKMNQNSENGDTHEDFEADKHWEKHLSFNQSVIVDTFQGQFKSKVVCVVCNHVSVTYEPFMYLSVPLPHAMERQFKITYVPASSNPPIRCLVSLNKQSKIIKLKEELLKTLEKEDMLISNIVLAEVFQQHISRLLEDNSPIRYINDSSRDIYAFELINPTGGFTNPLENGIENGTCTGEEVGQCSTCLDEIDGQLYRHNSSNCNVTMCENCIENYLMTESKTCPTCSNEMNSTSFVKMDEPKPRPTVRILNVPFLLRCDPSLDVLNNSKEHKIFGHSHILRLPSTMNVQDLYETVKQLVPQDQNYILRFVDGQGIHCSRCLYTVHCTGCKLPESGTITFQAKDTLAVCYVDAEPSFPDVINHSSLNKKRTLYDCLRAFSQSEQLDEHNPWFCPKCERNQCATKTLTVYRYPKYLIVYLKRFVYHESVCMKLDDKVTFPLDGLEIEKNLYDLYACVCHYGGVSAGHYTAYAKNHKTGDWYLYNDEIITKQKPEDESSNAYILFYSQRGTNKSINNSN